MDEIRFGEDAADPNAFAIALINTGMSGSTEGFDELIADTEAMEQEIKSITPPRSCEKYHETSLEALGHACDSHRAEERDLDSRRKQGGRDCPRGRVTPNQGR